MSEQTRRSIPDTSNYETRYYKETHNEELLPYLALRQEKKTTTPTTAWFKAIGDGFFGGSLPVQIIVTVLSAYLTRAVAFYGLDLGIFLAYAIVSTAGSTAAPQLAAAWNVGVFAGMAGLTTLPNWAWFTLLACSSALMWALFLHFKVLVGFGGRLGTAVFICHNLVVSLIVAPANAIPWSVYGSPLRTYSDLVSWQYALSLIIAAPVGAVISFLFRNLGQSMENPVTGANVAALLLMLVVTSATDSGGAWIWTTDVLIGITIGSFVGMSSTDRLSGGIKDFILAALFAVGYLLIFTPFFEGGKLRGAKRRAGNATITVAIRLR
ncbi:hypothetical protein TL16_g02331 [Triparma laevis f. inornata]|uniref:Uncharacterized protein n=2 Tax=Triparma laevis TaxID=1534972 RepID=A0A9W7AZM6_9STRA|nr:hypothetical protein TL16_g02331 [Triparma laevis f. inornata]GMH78885.1 hypothetical protein TrLO_g8620 [Triparma laevis f. longispina]